mmetsp:Transcript_5805/g.6803  ORF Transcript_5805/g.6803 Transcript_5805/m.6803 type:complete len:84 (+) Transcript_5805:131-382(+)
MKIGEWEQGRPLPPRERDQDHDKHPPAMASKAKKKSSVRRDSTSGTINIVSGKHIRTEDINENLMKNTSKSDLQLIEEVSQIK